MKEEIIGGFKNALDRNETIEKAMQTFINAGYSATEVREAASMVNPSATGMLYGQPSTSPASQSSAQQTAQAGKPATLPKQQAPAVSPVTAAFPVTNVTISAQQNKGRKTAIILAIVLIILVLVLGATIFFSQGILDMFST